MLLDVVFVWCLWVCVVFVVEGCWCFEYEEVSEMVWSLWFLFV